MRKNSERCFIERRARSYSYCVRDIKTLRDSSVCEFEDEGIRRLGSIRVY